MQVPILRGVYADANADFRAAYPCNFVPVPADQGLSNGYLRPADGIDAFATGPGKDRGGINWNGSHFRVMGTSLVRVGANGSVEVLGDVGGSGPVSLDYGFDALAIASGGRLFYWDGLALAAVSDEDMGTVLDACWLAGYYLTTDGQYIVATDLDDRMSVNPLRYGSSETDPDPIMAVDKLHNEAWALNRYSFDAFQNVGGDGFPFQRIPGAGISKGVIGTHAYVNTGDTFIFLGSGRNEPPGVWRMQPGGAEKVSTREIDLILQGYKESQLAETVCELRAGRNQMQVIFHLPDQALVFDPQVSAAIGEPAWYTLSSAVAGKGTYRARDAVWVYDRWICGDPTSNAIGVLTNRTAEHFGQKVGWSFGAMLIYADGNDALIHELELVCLTGRVSGSVDPVIWTSYSHNGEDWSQERSTRAGSRGQRQQRICWRTQGTIRGQRMQRFRGTSDAFLSIARLQVAVEPLATRPVSA